MKYGAATSTPRCNAAQTIVHRPMSVRCIDVMNDQGQATVADVISTGSKTAIV